MAAFFARLILLPPSGGTVIAKSVSFQSKYFNLNQYPFLLFVEENGSRLKWKENIDLLLHNNNNNIQLWTFIPDKKTDNFPYFISLQKDPKDTSDKDW
jgi:hypothetical protein